MTAEFEAVEVGAISDLDDPGCREFMIGEGVWPFRGFVVRRGNDIFAYQNVCVHAGHPLNWTPNNFFSKDRLNIVCASHGAVFDIQTGNCVAGPGSGRALHKVEVEVRDGIIWVNGPTRRV